jgi:hypothetical protein
VSATELRRRWRARRAAEPAVIPHLPTVDEVDAPARYGTVFTPCPPNHRKPLSPRNSRSEVPMRRIIYCSQATYDIAPDELVELLDVCRRNNEAAGLSGMLLHSNQSFLQVLEGESDALSTAYGRIEADDRHTHLRLLADTSTPAALFPDWTMGFEHVDDEELADELDGFTPATLYPLVNPDLITNAGVAVTLLKLYAKNRVR